VDAVEGVFVMDERLRFVARLLEGDAMTDLCREFGISRKTGYKIFNRDKEHGFEAVSDRSRRPVRYANQLPPQLEGLIVRCKRDKPHWGARKIRELVVRRLDGDIRGPARSTLHAVHDREAIATACGRIGRRRKRVNLSTVRAGQKRGIKEVGEGIWLVSFLDYDLGYIDLEQKTLHPLDNPFGPRVSPIS
jgi:transposase